MSTVPKKVKPRTNVEVYKHIRKEPIPPGQTFRAKDRDLALDDDETEMDKWMGWKGESLEEYEDAE